MHQLVSLKLKIALVLGLNFLVAMIIEKLALQPLAMGVTLTVVNFVVTCLLVFSWKIAFKFSWLPAHWITRDLTGTWLGEIKSEWYADNGQPTPPPIGATLQVIQSWAEIRVILTTNNMEGPSFAAVPHYDPLLKRLELRYFYTTSPLPNRAVTNPPQLRGAALARIDLNSADRMTIYYTNERGKGGEINLTRTIPSRVVEKELL